MFQKLAPKSFVGFDPGEVKFTNTPVKFDDANELTCHARLQSVIKWALTVLVYDVTAIYGCIV